MAATTRRYISCADTAKLVRAALKAAFPGQKFSVRSDTYANGASIRVAWTDGPTTKKVDAVCALYQGATFDGMIDLKESVTSLLTTADGGVEEVSFGADWILTSRTLSAEKRAEVEAKYEAKWGIPFDTNGKLPGDSYWGGPDREFRMIAEEEG